jgi:tetratricopeptide (TPR) repeat protein
VDWAYSYYLKGYALIELGNYTDAKPLIEKAIEMMPQNAQFLSELGHIYQVEKNWDTQIEVFQRAEKAATTLPKENGSANLARAWRGIAFALTEQGKLDESTGYYKKCLELNPNDQTAVSELRYIQQLRAKQGAQ